MPAPATIASLVTRDGTDDELAPSVLYDPNERTLSYVHAAAGHPRFLDGYVEPFTASDEEQARVEGEVARARSRGEEAAVDEPADQGEVECPKRGAIYDDCHRSVKPRPRRLRRGVPERVRDDDLPDVRVRRRVRRVFAFTTTCGGGPSGGSRDDTQPDLVRQPGTRLRTPIRRRVSGAGRRRRSRRRAGRRRRRRRRSRAASSARSEAPFGQRACGNGSLRLRRSP